MSDATINLSSVDAEPAARKKPAGKTVARLTLAAIALLAIGGGWYGYERVKGTAGIPMAAPGDFVPDGGGGGGMRFGFGGNRPPRAPAPPRPGITADGVDVMPGNVVNVRSGGLTMRALGRADGKWQLTFVRSGAADDREAIQLYNLTRRRILEPKRPAADVKVTAAQLAALAAAVPESPAELTPDAFARASALLAQLAKLPPADAKATPMKDELQAIAATASKTDANAVAKEYEARAAKIRAILSAEQVETLLGRRAARAAATPATKPVAK